MKQDARSRLKALLDEREERCGPVWDALWRNDSIGRIAVGVGPTKETIDKGEAFCRELGFEPPPKKPTGWTEEWHESLLQDVRTIYATLPMPGDLCSSLHVPRFVHGQSQGFCDLFGLEVEKQPDNNMYVHPLPADPARVRDVETRALESSMYWGAVEWVRYAHDVTEGMFGFRNQIMTGPFDTANYLLGTTTLLEWVYTEPATLHGLLDKVTGVIIDMLKAFREAAGGEIYSAHHLRCMRGGYDFASECRSLLSRETYEDFEAPYLRRIGEELGPYAIHACGGWERTVPSARQDPNLRAMNGQVRENDLTELCRVAQGEVTLSIGPSANLPPKYTWTDTEAYYKYILDNTPPDQPLETGMSEKEMPLWNRLCKERGMEHNCVVVDASCVASLPRSRKAHCRDTRETRSAVRREIPAAGLRLPQPRHV